MKTKIETCSGKQHTWAHTRVEGMSFADILRRPALPFYYLRKYQRGRFCQSQNVIERFDHQRTQIRNKTFRPLANGEAVTLAMGGDIMWIGRGWESYCSQGVRDFLHSFDAVVANLETPIMPSGRVPKPFLPDSFWFNSPPDLLDGLARDGTSPFAALSIANNHALDMGDKGLLETMEILKSRDIGHSGATVGGKDGMVHVFERRFVRFGFYAATYGTNRPQHKTENVRLNVMAGIVPPLKMTDVDLSGAEAAIKEMTEKQVDVRIISLHWGNEFELYPDPSLLPLSRALVAMGFDIVMGHHPHVVQPSEVVFVNCGTEGGSGCRIDTPDGDPRKAIIHWSLGNFVTAMRTPLTRIGAVQQLSFIQRHDRIEWFNPEHTFVINLPRSAFGDKARLVLENELDLGLVPQQPEYFHNARLHCQYLRNHLNGPENESLTRAVRDAATFRAFCFQSM